MSKKSLRVKGNSQSQRSVRFRSANYADAPVCWQFSLMNSHGEFSCSEITPEEWQLIISKMKQWETMTWHEIEGRRDHAIDIDNLDNIAKKRLVELQLDDIDELFSLHIDGKKRLFGIRDRNIFRVLWWDKDHKVCPARLKHT